MDVSIPDKISRIAKTLYGAKEVIYPQDVSEKVKLFRKLKIDNLPICMMKTQYSLSHDPKRKGRPRNFKLPISDVHLSAGAGYIGVVCGDMRTIPGLPKNPSGMSIDIDKNWQTAGLF